MDYGYNDIYLFIFTRSKSDQANMGLIRSNSKRSKLNNMDRTIDAIDAAHKYNIYLFYHVVQ